MISLLPRIQTIEEVKIGYKPTGHLETDLGKLYRDKELEDLKKLTMASIWLLTLTKSDLPCVSHPLLTIKFLLAVPA